MPEKKEFQSPISNEIFNGFYDRMKVNAVAQTIGISAHVITDNVKEKLKNENPDTLDSLLIATLLFIKNKELAEEPCRLEEISAFYSSADMRYFFPWLNATNSFAFAKFIIINVLQNRGVPFRKKIINPQSDSVVTEIVFRLLDEKNQSYTLTEQARDYIYRTNEIDKVFEYSVSVFKIREDVQKKNYSKAMQQTVELMDQIKQLKKSMESFIIRCKTDITSVSSEQYSDTINSYYELMKKETASLSEIQKNVQKDISEIQEKLDEVSVINDKKAVKNLATLQAITENLGSIIAMQQEFITYTNQWRMKYLDILKNSIKISINDHMDFKKDIVDRLIRTSYPLSQAMHEFLLPLKGIHVPRYLSIESLLEPAQIQIKSENAGIDLNPKDTNTENEFDKDETEPIRQSIIDELTDMLISKKDFYLSEFIETLDESTLCRFSHQQILGETASLLFQEAPIHIHSLVHDETKKGEDHITSSVFRDIFTSLSPTKKHLSFDVQNSDKQLKYSIYKNKERIEFCITDYHFSICEGKNNDE